MSAARHTPGPFTAKGAEIYGADGYHIASTDGVHLKKGWRPKSGQHWGTTPGAAVERSEDEEEATAVLLAAAPDLLEALEDLSDLIRRGWTYADDIEVSRALNRAEAALKKAREAA